MRLPRTAIVMITSTAVVASTVTSAAAVAATPDTTMGFNADFSVVALSGFSYFAPARVEGTDVSSGFPPAVGSDYGLPFQISVTKPPKPGASIQFGLPQGARITNADAALAPICKPQSGGSVTKTVSSDVKWPNGTVGPNKDWPLIAPPSPAGWPLESGTSQDTFRVGWAHCDLVDPANWPVADSAQPFTALLAYHVNPSQSSLENFVKAATGTRGSSFPTYTTNAGMPILYADGDPTHNPTGASLTWTQLGTLTKPTSPTPVLRMQNTLPAHFIPGPRCPGRSASTTSARCPCPRLPTQLRTGAGPLVPARARPC